MTQSPRSSFLAYQPSLFLEFGRKVALATRLRNPQDRLGTPEDIAQMAVPMPSDLASYVTGTSVFIDGGMTLYPSFIHGG